MTHKRECPGMHFVNVYQVLPSTQHCVRPWKRAVSKKRRCSQASQGADLKYVDRCTNIWWRMVGQRRQLWGADTYRDIWRWAAVGQLAVQGRALQARNSMSRNHEKEFDLFRELKEGQGSNNRADWVFFPKCSRKHWRFFIRGVTCPNVCF